MLERVIGRGQNGTDKVGLGTTRRPVIGLALGGGSARGFAHIGIVKALIAHGIVPDVVVGTSIGGVVGGAYATGHLDRLEEWARSLQPRSVLSYLDIRLNGSGLIGGTKLAAELEASIGPTMIEDLPIKFATVATEVRTGHEIWLTRGRMVDAMRASYALPGIFSPVLIGDRWLVDGALVNPVPVSAERAHDVALGQGAGHPPLRPEHDQRADPVLGQNGDRVFERRVGVNRGDVTALVSENRFDSHVGRLPTETAAHAARQPFSTRLAFGIESRRPDARPMAALCALCNAARQNNTLGHEARTDEC